MLVGSRGISYEVLYGSIGLGLLSVFGDHSGIGNYLNDRGILPVYSMASSTINTQLNIGKGFLRWGSVRCFLSRQSVMRGSTTSRSDLRRHRIG